MDKSGGCRFQRRRLARAVRRRELKSGTLTLEGTGEELINNPHVRKAYLGA